MKRTSLSPKRKKKRTRVYRIVDNTYEVIEGREICLETAAGRREYRHRRELMAARQKMLCPLCGKTLIGWHYTTDHEAGRGGGRRDDRTAFPDGQWMNAAVHGHCNTQKGSRRYAWQQGEYLPVVRADFPEAA